MSRKIIDTLTKGLIYDLFVMIELIIFSIGSYEIIKNSNMIISIIGLGLFSLYKLVIMILKSKEPYFKSIKIMKSKNKTYEKMQYYNDEVIPQIQKHIPRTIYKYISFKSIKPELDKELIDIYKVENNKKYDSLRNNKIWLSNVTKLNDPCEGQHYIYSSTTPAGLGIIDTKKAEEYCKKRSLSFYEVYTKIKSFVYTSSFSYKYNSMPMWAHYASNHEGICVEYEVIDNSKLYEIQYFVGKIDIGFEMEKLYEEYVHMDINENEYFDTLNKINVWLYTIKSHEWKYEQEVRVILNYNIYDKPGINISCEELGLKIKCIYIGINCSEENEKEIKLLAEQIGIPTQKMKFDPIKRSIN